MSEKNARLWMTLSGHCYDDREYEAFAEVFLDDAAVFDYLAERGFRGLVWRPPLRLCHHLARHCET